MNRPAREQARPMPAFRQCPGCSFDFVSGDGVRACNWFDCAYLPDEIKVFCPDCGHNFYTDEGTPACGDVPSCEWAAEGRMRAAVIRAQYGPPDTHMIS